MTLPLNLIKEKNKIATDTGAWVVLVELDIQGEDTIYLTDNNEDIEWNGNTWISFPFVLDTITQDSQGSLPSYKIKISNITREYTKLVDEHLGAVDGVVKIRVVNSNYLNELTPLFYDESRIVETGIDLKYITFTLGAINPTTMLSPRERYLANHCRYKEFKGSECGYSGQDGSCDRTFADCKSKGNIDRFGGFPAILQQQGIIV